MNRIECISKYILDTDYVLDVGCDQAKLSKLLSKRHIYSIASDIKENIISKAKLNLTLEEKKYITFRVGSGITLTSDENNFTLVMSGMGSYLMINILKNTTKRFNKIITISNNNHTYLRKEMLKLNYYISKEEIILDKGKYYNLIIFDTIKREYTNIDLLIGYNHINKCLLKQRNTILLNKYKEILKSTSNPTLIEKVNILENYKY